MTCQPLLLSTHVFLGNKRDLEITESYKTPRKTPLKAKTQTRMFKIVNPERPLGHPKKQFTNVACISLDSFFSLELNFVRVHLVKLHDKHYKKFKCQYIRSYSLLTFRSMLSPLKVIWEACRRSWETAQDLRHLPCTWRTRFASKYCTGSPRTNRS